MDINLYCNPFFAVRSSFRPESVKQLLNLLIKFYGAVIVVCLAMLFFSIDSMPLFNTFSWSVLHETPTSTRFGILGVAAVSLTTILFASSKSIVRDGWGKMFGLAVVGVILSGGRGAFIALFSAGLLWYGMKKRRIAKVLTIGSLAIVAFVLFSISPLITSLPSSVQRLFILLPSEFYENKLPQIADEAAASSSSWRYAIWVLAYDKIVENPITGTGYGLPSNIPDEDLSGGETSVHDFLVMGNTHNSFISIAYIMGIPAMLVFASWLGYLMISINRLRLSSVSSISVGASWLFLLLATQVVYAFSSDIHIEYEFIVAAAIAESLLAKEATRRPSAKEIRL